MTPARSCQAPVPVCSWTTTVPHTLSCRPCLRGSKAAHRYPKLRVRSHRRYPSHRRNAVR